LLYPETKVSLYSICQTNFSLVTFITFTFANLKSSKQGVPFEIMDELYAQGVKPRHFKARAREIMAARIESETELETHFAATGKE